MREKYVLLCTVILLLAATPLLADDVSTYLILNDILPYIRLVQTIDAYSHKPKTIPGYTSHPGSGVLAGADHFIDHPDMTYETTYQSEALDLGVEVQVTQHSGSDSDKWLLHELDLEFRNYYGKPGYYLKTINGNIVYVYGAGGRDYRWISNNKVVMIEYHDAQLTKPEPIEVIQAYLAKHPSTTPSMTMNDLNSPTSKTTWIKDEMDRRLWLCDKWFYQLQLAKVQQRDAFQAAVKSMNVFLDYREKYYVIKAADEKNLIASYLNTNNGTGIKAKLKEYKDWWALHRADAISF